MTKQQLKAAIIKVAEATDQTIQSVTDKLEAKDNWTWFLVREANK